MLKRNLCPTSLWNSTAVWWSANIRPSLLNEQQYIMFSWPLVVIHSAVWTGSTGLNIHSITRFSNTYLQHLSTVYFICGFGVQLGDTRLIRQADRVIPLCVYVCVCLFLQRTSQSRKSSAVSLETTNIIQWWTAQEKSFERDCHQKEKSIFFSADCFTKEMRVCSVRVDWHFLYMFIFCAGECI